MIQLLQHFKIALQLTPSSTIKNCLWVKQKRLNFFQQGIFISFYFIMFTLFASPVLFFNVILSYETIVFKSYTFPINGSNASGNNSAASPLKPHESLTFPCSTLESISVLKMATLPPWYLTLST